jgi:hypothetical protein
MRHPNRRSGDGRGWQGQNVLLNDPECHEVPNPHSEFQHLAALNHQVLTLC